MIRYYKRWLGSRVVSVLNSGAEGPGFKSQPRRCRVTVLGKLFTPIVPLFTNHASGEGANVLHSTGDRDNDSAIVNRCSPPALANRFRRYDAPANGRASASRRRPNWLLVIRCADDKTPRLLWGWRSPWVWVWGEYGDINSIPTAALQNSLS